MSLRKAFATSDALEKNGVALSLGNTRITMLRTGSSVNSKFNAAMQAIHREHKIALDNDLMSDRLARGKLAKAFATHVVTDWETNVGTDDNEDWRDGIEAPGWNDDDQSTKQVVPATLENIIAAFMEMEDLFRECLAFSRDHKNYRAALLDEIAGN